MPVGRFAPFRGKLTAPKEFPMRDRDPEQLNKKDDLVDVKELVRDAEPGPSRIS